MYDGSSNIEQCRVGTSDLDGVQVPCLPAVRSLVRGFRGEAPAFDAVFQFNTFHLVVEIGKGIESSFYSTSGVNDKFS